jgi:hypothetical protein
MSSFADSLNRDDRSLRLQHDALGRAVAALDDGAEWAVRRLEQRVALAGVPLFVDVSDLETVKNAIRAIIAVTELPGYRDRVLATAPSIARHPTPAAGLFFGYDFHLTPEGPALIEINTNAGGALVCSAVLSAVVPTGSAWPVEVTQPPDEATRHGAFVRSFQEEFALAHPGRTLRSIRIVDDTPEDQYLYPEFLLYRGLLRKAGYDAEVVSPAELRCERGQLWHGRVLVDLVYNRLVDFYLELPEHETLRQAYLEGAAVITPHPRAHALFAAKQHLCLLGNEKELAELGVGEPTRTLLASVIPETRLIGPGHFVPRWEERKAWFLKPVHGYGSRAAYRGDKLTRANFDRIVAEGGYVAQKVVPPSERHVPWDGKLVALRADLRAFVCSDEVLLFAARLYHGQTTNMRTPGGGFAAVLPVLSPPPA